MASLIVRRRSGEVHTVLFDDADAKLVMSHSWYVRIQNKNEFTKYYAVTNWPLPDGTRTKMHMHTLLMGAPYVDHVNHDGLDNRRANLRVGTQSQNLGNMRPRGGASKYKGVSRSDGKWMARIQVAGKRKNLGRFATEEDAARAYDEAALAAWGEFALLNF